jgi:hypothetical protein
MPKYRITGTNLRNQPHKEVVDAQSAKFAMSTAYARGMSARHPARLVEIDDQGNEISAEEIPADHTEGINPDFTNSPLNSKLLRDPVTTIAMGVFAGLFLFFCVLMLFSCLMGNANFHMNF